MEIELIDKSAATAIAEYSRTAAALAKLKGRLSNIVYDVSTGKGMDIARKDRAEVRGLISALEAKRVELKAPALERSRLIDAEAKRIAAELEALKTPIDEVIKAEETRKAAEKADREQAEREAAAAVQGRIDYIRSFVIDAAGGSAKTVAYLIDGLREVEVSLDLYGERAGEAAQIKAQAAAKLDEMHAAAVAHEAEQARMAAEREELARQREQQEAAAQAERERVAAAQKAEAERLAADRKTFEQEQAEDRAEHKKRVNAESARRAAEDRKAREARAAEDKRLADARAEVEAAARAIRAEVEAKAAAARKEAQDAADAAAAIERKRLDDEAAARRADEKRKADEAEAQRQRDTQEMMATLEAADRLRDAAPRLLAILQRVRQACDHHANADDLAGAMSILAPEIRLAVAAAEGGAA